MTEPQTERSDELLMQAYARGDAAAFECLFDRHRRALFTYLLHQVGSQSAAEDLFQEVFLRLIRVRDRYSPSGGFRAWLYTIARNALTDHRRRGALRCAESEPQRMNGRRRQADKEQSWEHRIVSGDADGDPLRRSQHGELQERLETALHALPEEQREVFLLRERAGLDFRAIAEVTGCALGTVKSRMRYALAGLRQRLSIELASQAETFHE